MFVMYMKTLLSLIQLKFESIVATLIYKIYFQIVSCVEKEIVKKKFHRCKKFAVNQKVRKIIQ